MRVRRMRLQGDILRRRTWARLLLRVRDRVPLRGRGLVLGMDGAGGEVYRSVWNPQK